jgi:hypothetical protein
MKIRNTNNCPICQGVLTLDVDPPRRVSMQGSCQSYDCYTPLDKMPLHYYSHTVRPVKPHKIISQEFSIDLGNRWVILTNDYSARKTYIKSRHDTDPLMVPVILMPDFPDLENLKNKIRMAIVFS